MMGSTAVPGSSSADLQSIGADVALKYPDEAFGNNNGIYQEQVEYLQPDVVYQYPEGAYQPEYHHDQHPGGGIYQEHEEEYPYPEGVYQQYPEEFYYDPDKMFPVYDDYGIFVGYQLLDPSLQAEDSNAKVTSESAQ